MGLYGNGTEAIDVGTSAGFPAIIQTVIERVDECGDIPTEKCGFSWLTDEKKCAILHRPWRDFPADGDAGAAQLVEQLICKFHITPHTSL